MAAEKVLEIRKLSLGFGGLQVLVDVDLEVRAGEILAVIGPNGAGKTSLLNCINGFYRAQRGSIAFRGRPIQDLKPHQMAARHVHMRRGALLGALFCGPARREEIEHRELVEEIIDFLELEPVRKKIVGALPYGVRKRVELGRALAMDPALLLLDEPMAGMNVEEKEDMARFILDVSELRGTPMIIVEHDMEVIMDISDRAAVLDFGHKIAEGAPTEIVRDPRVIRAYLGEEESGAAGG